MAALRTPFLAGALRSLSGGHSADVCPSCGYSWSIEPAAASARVASAPPRLAAACASGDCRAHPADGSWNATAYVWHLTDLVRSWSERWVQLSHTPGALLVAWDPDAMAVVRSYTELPTEAGLWALETSVATFVELTAALAPDTRFAHAEWGPGDVADAVRWIGHEFQHHEQDVEARIKPAR